VVGASFTRGDSRGSSTALRTASLVLTILLHPGTPLPRCWSIRAVSRSASRIRGSPGAAESYHRDLCRSWTLGSKRGSRRGEQLVPKREVVKGEVVYLRTNATATLVRKYGLLSLDWLDRSMTTPRGGESPMRRWTMSCVMTQQMVARNQWTATPTAHGPHSQSP